MTYKVLHNRFHAQFDHKHVSFRADIADALVARGDVARAALILQRHCQLLLREAWWQLAAVLLPRLLHCQKLLLQASRCTSIVVQVSDHRAKAFLH